MALLREDRGEIEAAGLRALPRLIGLTDLQGDLHVHTNASDGSDSLEKRIAAAKARGLHYAAITDHSRHLGVTHSLDAARLDRQAEVIDRLNETLTDFTVLKGAEVGILDDGRLAYSDSLLKRLDVVVIAVHNQFELSEARQTERVLTAIQQRGCLVNGARRLTARWRTWRPRLAGTTPDRRRERRWSRLAHRAGAASRNRSLPLLPAAA